MPRPVSRRTFLRQTAGVTAATWGSSLWMPGLAQARAQSLAMAVSPDGTTLVSTYAADGTTGYLRLKQTEGWPTVVRELNAVAKSGRGDTRRSIGSIVHLTDVHVVDGQSPARVEFLDRQSDPPQQDAPVEGAWRPQETLATHISDAMNQQLKDVGGGPITGRAYDCAVSTGDNVDNMQVNELAWFMSLLDGGSQLAPNSGDPAAYEGVMDLESTTYDLHYWHPDDATGMLTGNDNYKKDHGFPTMPGFLEASIAPFTPTGIGVRWYSCFGNHDGLLQGNAPSNAAFNAIATGSAKVVNLPAGVTTGDIANGLATQDPTAAGALFSGPARQVTADENRRTLTIQDWVQAHLDSPAAPGPSGHGYTEEALDTLRLYYTFPIAEGVLGISLDTVNRAGYAEGSIGATQLAWLEEQLISASSSYYDSAGTKVDNAAGEDHLIVLFSHHNIPTLNNPLVDPTMPDDERVQAGPVQDLLHRFGNVVLWVNGHSHVNRVSPFPDPAGLTGGFWEVSTAAHIDYPQQSRIVELVDNADGTLSIFGTLVDHAGPAQAALSTDVLALASIARELGLNDPQRHGPDDGLGTAEDQNVELVLAAPFSLASVGAPVNAAGSTTGGTPGAVTGGAGAGTGGDASGGAGLADTGGGAVALAAIALTGAVALRARRDPATEAETDSGA